MVEKIIKYFSKRKCNCGDPNCLKQIKSTKNGRLYVENLLTCGNIKNFINKYKNQKF